MAENTDVERGVRGGRRAQCKAAGPCKRGAHAGVALERVACREERDWAVLRTEADGLHGGGRRSAAHPHSVA
eukprot:7379691-Prymnesium_polylepis.2